MANQGEYKVVVSVDNVYVAKVLQDDASGFVTDTPEYLAPAMMVSQEPNNSSETIYADGAPFDVLSGRGDTKLTLDITGLPAAMQAKLTGGTFDAANGRVYDNEGTPDYYAMGYRSEKSNGSFRYYWFLKGRFDAPKEEAATKKDKPEPKNPQLIYTALKTTHAFDLGGGVTDKVKRVYGDEDTDDFDATDWFTQVQTPAAVAPSALALSLADPLDGATGVAVDKTITLTFNNRLPASAIHNVVVVKADGTAVACTNTLNAAGKVMTVNPDSNLDAASTYIVTIGVADVFGQNLNAAINFGTA